MIRIEASSKNLYDPVVLFGNQVHDYNERDFIFCLIIEKDANSYLLNAFLDIVETYKKDFNLNVEYEVIDNAGIF